MANKYTRKGRQQAPVAEDEFVSFWTRAYEALLPHASRIGIGLLAAVVVMIGFWVGASLRDRGREDATELFGRAVKTYEADLLPAEQPKDQKDQPKDQKDVAKDEESSDDVKRFKTADERAQAVIAMLDEIRAKHRFARAAKEAELFKAGVLYDQGKFAEAEAAYRKFLDEAPADHAMRAIAREGVGLALESENKLDAALDEYKQMEPKTGDFFRDRVLLDEARVLTKKGDKAGAEKTLKDILAKSPTTSLREEIQSRLTELGGT